MVWPSCSPTLLGIVWPCWLGSCLLSVRKLWVSYLWDNHFSLQQLLCMTLCCRALLLLLLPDEAELLIGRQPTAAAASRGRTSAFPQATTAAEFPAAVHDALALDGLLTTEEKEVRRRVRAFAVRLPGELCSSAHRLCVGCNATVCMQPPHHRSSSSKPSIRVQMRKQLDCCLQCCCCCLYAVLTMHGCSVCCAGV